MIRHQDMDMIWQANVSGRQLTFFLGAALGFLVAGFLAAGFAAVVSFLGAVFFLGA